MACGCSIVGSEGMPVGEVINHNTEGMLVPMDDPQRLADQVLELLAAPDLRRRLGKAARQRALLYDQRLTLSAMSELLEGEKIL